MIRIVLFIIISAVGSVTFSQQNCVYLASDIYPGSYGALPVSITEFNGALYFSATGNSSGPELWKYENGISSMVADINPGLGGSMPNQLTVMGSNLYFTASTGTTGMELFKYDGTSVSNVADINPGSSSSFVNYLTVIGSELYFTATDGVNGTEPWKFDGTSATMIADINPGSASSNPDEFAGAAGFVFFTGSHPSYGFELWKYDGTSAVVQDLYPGTSGSDLGELTAIGSKLCFRATNGTQGYELWTHDGTTATCLDVCTVGPGDFTPWEFISFGGAVYFRGFIQTTGYELWKYDGTSATLVADIFPGGGNAHPNHFAAASSVLYFAANNGTVGNELWMYDGTTASLVSDLNPGSAGSMPYAVSQKFATIGDDVFIVADNGTIGDEIWRYDGTALSLSKDIVLGSTSSSPSGLTGFGNSLYFMADNMVNGGELWAWDPDQVLTDSIAVESCGQYTSPAGDLYTINGVYDFIDTIPSINCPGCDSLITVHLTLSNPVSSITVTSCGSYTSPGGNTYNLMGNYYFTDTIPSIACPGIDSIITIDLTVEANFNLSIFVFQGVTFVSQAGANYQWLDCDAGYAPIPGANDQDFLPTVDGNYACIITSSTCSDTTACVFVESTFDPNVGLSEQIGSDILVYPNPVSEQLLISNTSNSLMSVKIYSILGAEIFFKQNHNSDPIEIDMSDFSKGIYQLEISTPTDKYYTKVIKE